LNHYQCYFYIKPAPSRETTVAIILEKAVIHETHEIHERNQIEI